MSSAVFPSLPGLGWSVQRQPLWKTSLSRSASGRAYTSALMTSPRYRYTLTYEFLRAGQGFTELQQLVAFFNARGGMADTWLFSDPDDNTATAQQFGVGDGATRSFQLVRSFGGYIEPVYAPQGSPSIFINAVLQGSGYTINANTGVVTFTVAPTAGLALTWTGTFYWISRFNKDMQQFNQFLRQLWELKTLEFETEKP